MEQQLFSLHRFVDKSNLGKQHLLVAFVDLRQAYDSVRHMLPSCKQHSKREYMGECFWQFSLCTIQETDA